MIIGTAICLQKIMGKKRVSYDMLSDILGHADASFTLDRYAHVTADMQEKASEIVGGIMTDILKEVD